MKDKMMILGVVFLLIMTVFSTGCLDEDDDDYDLRVAVTIPPQREWVERIGGDNIDVVVMVPPGEDPHTFEPDPGLMQKLSDADIYFKLGSGMEFEERYMDNIKDQNPDMVVVDASEAINLRHFGDAHVQEIGKFEIVDRSVGDIAAYVHSDHWHGSLPEVNVGEHISLGANIEDPEGNEIPLDGDHYELRVDLAGGANQGVVSFHQHTDHVHIVGETQGHTRVVFQLWDHDRVEYQTPSITVFVGEGEHEDDISEFQIIDRSKDEVTAYVHGDHWHGSLPEVNVGEHISLGANIQDAEGNEIILDGDHYELRVDLAEGADEGIVSFHQHTDHVHIVGDTEGQTEVAFQLWHDGHVEYETPSIAVFVEEEQKMVHGTFSLTSHDHNEGADPHTWMSLTKAEKMIEHLVNKIVEVDPDNEELYRENAADYIAELQGLHQNISENMAPYRGEKFLIYHPSMGYFADDYRLVQLAIEIEGEDPGPGQIAGIIDIAKEEDIRIIFVSPQFDDSAAKTIAEEIDGEVKSLNPLSDGYLDNIEQIARALVESFSEKEREDDISEFKVIDRSKDEVTAYVHGDHWHGSLPVVHVEEHVSLGASIEDAEGNEIPLDGDHYELKVELAEGANEGIVSFHQHTDHVHIVGEMEGQTEVVFQLWHQDHIGYETPPITVVVE